MKNLIVTCMTITFVSIASLLTAQSAPDIEFKQGDIEISAGIGLMNTFIDKNTTAPMPPVSLNIAYRLKKNISFGTYMGYSKTEYIASPEDGPEDDPTRPSLTNNYFQIGVRGTGHYVRDRVDFYGGAMVGYNFSVNEAENLGPDGRIDGILVDDFDDIVVFSGHIGVKYLITQHVGIYGEVGYGVSIFNLGITTRF